MSEETLSGSTAKVCDMTMDVANPKGADSMAGNEHESSSPGQKPAQLDADLIFTPEQLRAQLTAALVRVRELERDREVLRRRYSAAIRERDHHRAAADTLARSRSYRLGRTLVLLVKNPIKTSRRILRALVRRLKGRLAAGVTGSARSVSDNVRSGPAAAAEPAIKISSTGAAETRKPVLSDKLPVYAYIALGFDLDSLRSLARTVAQCALVTANHVPLIVTDVSAFFLLRDTGLAIEYVPGSEALWRHRDDFRSSAFLSDRLAELFRVHLPSRTFFVSREYPLELPQLLGLCVDTPT